MFLLTRHCSVLNASVESALAIRGRLWCDYHVSAGSCSSSILRSSMLLLRLLLLLMIQWSLIILTYNRAQHYTVIILVRQLMLTHEIELYSSAFTSRTADRRLYFTFLEIKCAASISILHRLLLLLWPSRTIDRVFKLGQRCIFVP